MSRRNQRGQRDRKSNIEVSTRSRKRPRVRPRVPLVMFLTPRPAGGIFYLGVAPLSEIREISNQINALEERKQTMEAEKQQLIKEVKWLESDAAVEKIAPGGVRPGKTWGASPDRYFRFPISVTAGVSQLFYAVRKYKRGHSDSKQVQLRLSPSPGAW